MKNPIVSAEWLKENLDKNNVIILDASLKNNISGDVSEFAGKQIPGARYFDIDNMFSDKSIDLPHMLCSEEQFETEAKKLGIPIIAIVDTNCDPRGIDFIIPGNDDSIHCIELFTSVIASASIEGRNIYESKMAEMKKEKDKAKAEADKKKDKTKAKKTTAKKAETEEVVEAKESEETTKEVEAVVETEESIEEDTAAE